GMPHPAYPGDPGNSPVLQEMEPLPSGMTLPPSGMPYHPSYPMPPQAALMEVDMDLPEPASTEQLAVDDVDDVDPPHNADSDHFSPPRTPCRANPVHSSPTASSSSSMPALPSPCQHWWNRVSGGSERSQTCK
ncbi:hypothetical protein CYMTET_31297, partial [Cymbomonas tetramitiformis]